MEDKELILKCESYILEEYKDYNVYYNYAKGPTKKNKKLWKKKSKN